jgi:energy-coupling factor transporter ATP-binding protein EcfA2
MKGIINMETKGEKNQELVSNIIQVIKNIENFNAEIKINPVVAQDIVNNCKYFVEFNGRFASAKYAAWKNINIEKYQQFRAEDDKDFHTSVTQKALVELGLVASDAPELIKRFEEWSNEKGLRNKSHASLRIFSIDKIIPVLVSTTTRREEAEKDYNKANFELVARPRFCSYFPNPRVDFNIRVNDKTVTASRQYSSKNEVVIGACTGDFYSIRNLTLSNNLKLDDIVFLKVVKEKLEYEMIFEDRSGNPVLSGISEVIPDLVQKGLNDFHSFVKYRGFNFSEELLTNYIYSLKTKPFVILSGISGTGKTKIAQLFAEFMCPDEEVEVVEEVSDRDDSFIYKVPQYFIKYTRIVLQNKVADLLETSLNEGNTEINVRFDGVLGKCWLGYANSKNRAKQILFSGEIGKYVRSQIKVGDFVKIYIENNGDEETIVFEKVTAKKKRIKKQSKRYSFISVRPDWTDNRSMLGFYNPITETYQPTEILKLMLRASQDPLKPYFVILDEMNLAKVEHYFSDFLSCLESRRFNGEGKVRSEELIIHDSAEELSYIDEDGNEYTIPKRLEVPLNMYFTGTVNVDDTTYMFSPKVLDRANVIEFNELDMDNYQEIIFNREPSSSDKGEYVKAADLTFINYFTDKGEYCLRLLKKGFNIELIQYYEKLKELNKILEDYHLHFGYRVIDEIMMYLTYGYEYNPEGTLIDMDLQVIQKILPKLYGNRKQLEIPLARLLRFCFNTITVPADTTLTVEERKYISQLNFKQIAELQYSPSDKVHLSEVKYDYIKEGAICLFPRSARKLYRMIIMLERQGYASFIE